jgi:hypothetical protein
MGRTFRSRTKISRDISRLRSSGYSVWGHCTPQLALRHRVITSVEKMLNPLLRSFYAVRMVAHMSCSSITQPACGAYHRSFRSVSCVYSTSRSWSYSCAAYRRLTSVTGKRTRCTGGRSPANTGCALPFLGASACSQLVIIGGAVVLGHCGGVRPGTEE